LTKAYNHPYTLLVKLEAAIRSELKTLAHGLNRTRERLTGFEKQYGFSTDEFKRRFASRELGETLDFLEWWGETKMLTALEERKRALEGVQIARSNATLKRSRQCWPPRW